MSMNPIRVMLVDDSSVVRGMIARALRKEANIEIIAIASNGAEALETIKIHTPDIIILDVEMPKMDGITALPILAKALPSTHIIMASTLTHRNASISLRALELGATDYLHKPTAQDKREVEIFYHDLIAKINGLAGVRKKAHQPAMMTNAASVPAQNTISNSPPAAQNVKEAYVLQPEKKHLVRAIGIASSTGGPNALNVLFSGLKGKTLPCPVFITQHMPATFTTVLAEQIANISGMPCKEASNGEIAKAGTIYVAPGDYHMLIRKEGGAPTLHLNQEPMVNFCRPAADPMFMSLAEVYSSNLMCLVLTGMGSDGMEGAKKVVDAGGSVISQNKSTSVVWGMPKAVAENGLCQAVLPLPDIAPYLIQRCV